jgi:hypothetical protein
MPRCCGHQSSHLAHQLHWEHPDLANEPYTPAVHRALQLAANIYDATTNRPGLGYLHLLSIFRPVYGPTTYDNTNFTALGIVGYQKQEQTDADLERHRWDIDESTTTRPNVGAPTSREFR